MKCLSVLDSATREGLTILKLPALESKVLLLGRNPCSLVNFGLYGVDGMVRLDVECNNFALGRLDVDLHRAPGRI